MGVMKTAERLTRRSYKRKIITLGVSLFSALAMFATGFASWIISSDAKIEGNGNVDVGVVTDESITIYDATVDGLAVNGTAKTDISFNPAVGDVKEPNLTQNPTYTADKGYGGRVYGSDDGDFEKLTVEFSAKITGKENIGELTVSLNVPDTVKAAAAANYIVLPKCATAQGGVKIIETVDSTVKVNERVASDYPQDVWTLVDNGDGSWTFTYSFEIKWGTEFGGMNPSLYYDLEAQSGLRGDQVRDRLYAFRAMLLGVSLEDYDPADTTTDIIGGFKFTVEADAKT